MSNDKLRQYLRNFIHQLAIWTIQKYQPGIIAITGTVGKTSTKEAIYTVLKRYRHVRANKGNFNNEIGMPLTILGDYEEIKGKLFWIKVTLISLLRLVFRMKYPELLILEYAADKPGDIKYLLDIAKPQISVITAIGDVPVHVEFYSGLEAVAREKSKIVEVLPSTGFAVLNYDDASVLAMKDRTRAHIMTYGFNKDAHILISNYEVRMEGKNPLGIAFKLTYGGSFVPVRLDGCFGRVQAYATAAAASVGIAFGLNLVKISEALLDYQIMPGRGRIIPGIKQTYILDDSYNASPLSMEAAIETAKNVGSSRKIAVLGDMLEIGKYAPEAHESIGRQIPKVFDILVTVGNGAKFIASAALKKGMPKKNVLSFDTADEAKLEVQKLMKKGDLILIKASHAIRLDKVIEEIRQI